MWDGIKRSFVLLCVDFDFCFSFFLCLFLFYLFILTFHVSLIALFVSHVQYGTDASSGQNAYEACCICGGGVTSDCVNTDKYYIDDSGNYVQCDWFDEDPSRCDAHLGSSHVSYLYGTDSVNIPPEEGCCACGGGSSGSSNETCVDVAGWEPSFYPGYDCTYPGICDSYAAYPSSGGLTSLDACCVCGGGLTGGSCVDNPAYAHPMYGADCSELINGLTGTNLQSVCDNSNTADANGLTASDACCACGGGLTETPTAAPTGAPSADPGCVDNVDFTDTYGYTCSQYTSPSYCGMV